MSRSYKTLGFTIVGIVAALAGALIAREALHDARPPLVVGTALTPAREIPDFALVDQDGNTFDRARLKDRWSLLFFGFTNCGDVCPTTLTLLADASRRFDDLPPLRQPQVIFVSVDAKRDTPEAIKAYLKHFDSRFRGLTGSQAALDALTTAMGVPSAIRPLENGAYAVDHSAAILVTDPRARLAALFTPPHQAEAIARDVRTLLEEYK